MKSSRSRLSRMVANRTLKTGVTKKLAQEIAAYLLKERRVSELDSILRDVQADWAEAGYVEVLATSAHELTPEIRRSITARVRKLYPNAKRIIITEGHDPVIIGGVRLVLANQQLDLSVESKLNRFKQLTTSSK